MSSTAELVLDLSFLPLPFHSLGSIKSYLSVLSELLNNWDKHMFKKILYFLFMLFSLQFVFECLSHVLDSAFRSMLVFMSVRVSIWIIILHICCSLTDIIARIIVDHSGS